MRQGFGRSEFLIISIVIGVVIIGFWLWNPKERARETRDAQRIADLTKVKQVIALYIATAQKPDLDAQGACERVYSNGIAAVDGTGWIPVNFTSIPGGSPLAALPLDPLNSGDYVYAYQCDEGDATFFKLRATMESKRYSKIYEVGTTIY